jgi:hypothetical protein
MLIDMLSRWICWRWREVTYTLPSPLLSSFLNSPSVSAELTCKSVSKFSDFARGTARQLIYVREQCKDSL